MPLYTITTSRELLIFPEDTADGQTVADADIRTLNPPSGLTLGTGCVVYRDNIIVVDDAGDEVYFLDNNTADGQTPSVLKRFDLPPIAITTFETSITLLGDQLVVGDSTGDDLFFVDRDTANNATATLNKTVILPSAITHIEGLTTDGTYVYALQNPGGVFPVQRVFVLDVDVADGEEADIIKRIDLPSTQTGFGFAYGVLYLDGKLYIANTNKISVIDAGTAHETTATIEREFDVVASTVTLRSLGYRVRGVLFTVTPSVDPIIEGNTFNLTISATQSVTGLTQPDFINVEGMTINSISGSGQTHTLNATATSGAGEVSFTIREDAVTQGNEAQTFRFFKDALNPATAEIVFSPQGYLPVQQFLYGIDANREFQGYVVFDKNANGLTRDDLRFTSTHKYRTTPIPAVEDVRLVDLDVGNNKVCYGFRFLVPDKEGLYTEKDAGEITVTLKRNAVREGNAEVSATIPYIANSEASSDSIFGPVTENYSVSFHASPVDFNLTPYNNASNDLRRATYAHGRLYFLDNGSGSGTLSNTRAIPYAATGGNALASEILDFGEVFDSQDKQLFYLNGKWGLIGRTTNSRSGTTFAAIQVIVFTQDGRELRVEQPDGDHTFGAGSGQNGSGIFISATADPSGLRVSGYSHTELSAFPDPDNTVIPQADEGFSDFTVSENRLTLPDNFRLTYSVVGYACSESRHYFISRSSSSTPSALICLVADTNFQIVPEECFIATHDGVGFIGCVLIEDTLMLISDRLPTQTGTTGTFYAYNYDLTQVSRPPAQRQLIYPVFVENGDSLDLDKYCKGAVKYIWDVDYTKPEFLSLSGSTLSVASDAVSEETAVLVKLKAVNYNGNTGDGAFAFYLLISPVANTAPVWGSLNEFGAYPGDSINLFDFVEDATSITAISLPSGTTLTDGVLTVGNTGGAAQVRATNAFGDTDFDFTLKVSRRYDASDYSPYFRYYIEIAGIDVTRDVLGPDGDRFPEISKDSDIIFVNEYRVNNAKVELSWRNGYYDSASATNFWTDNNLSQNGYLEPIDIYIENLIGGVWNRTLLFSGLILEPIANFSADTITFNCVDNTWALQNTFFRGVGVEKYDQFYQQEPTGFEGNYTPERSLLPIAYRSAAAWSGSSPLTIRTEQNKPEGVRAGGLNAYVSRTNLLSEGGLLAEPPLVKFRSPYQYVNAQFATDLLSNAAGLPNPNVDIDAGALDAPALQRIGNLQFNVANTRFQHIPTDWIYNASTDTYYALLSNDTDVARDMLISYNEATGRSKVIKTFGATEKVVQLASTDFDTFYVMSCLKTDTDTSVSSREARYADAVLYDSTESDTKIIRYVASTDTQTDFVAASHNNRPQVGLHYYAGFENDNQLFDWRGTTWENRSTFKVVNGNLYYRWAKNALFGVASVSSSGTVTRLFSESADGYMNHLNFAFDVHSNGDVYFVYATGTDLGSTLTIKQRTAGGTISTLHTTTVDADDLELLDANIADLEVPRGGFYLGCHEVVFHNNKLYLIVPIQRAARFVDNRDIADVYRNSAKTAGAVVYLFDTDNTAAGLQVLSTDATDPDNDEALYQFLTTGPRSLTLHENSVYFAEMPTVFYRLRSINPDDRASFVAGANQNMFPDARGALKRIDTNDRVEDLGNIFYDDAPFLGVATQMLSADGSLNMIAQHGDFDMLQLTDTVTSLPSNYQWIRYGDKLAFVFPEFAETSVYDGLVDVATHTNSLFFVENNIVNIVNKDPIRAKTDGGITATADTIPTTDSTQTLPTTGYMLIGGEIVQYTGKDTMDRLTGVTRGIGGTSATAHADETDMIYLDNIINSDSYLNISLQTDTNRFFNVVQDSALTERVADAGSISTFQGKEKVFNLDLNLDRHAFAWREYMYQKYLDELRDIRQLITVTLKPSFYINLADIIGFAYQGITHAMRVSSINYARDRTEIIGRSI